MLTDKSRAKETYRVQDSSLSLLDDPFVLHRPRRPGYDDVDGENDDEDEDKAEDVVK